MNLLQDPWMPVRDAQGQREWIAPDRLSEPQWRAFDADRPDFNGALAQFAIALLQTTAAVPDSIVWRRLFRQPPDAATLRGWFDPVRHAFELDGDGPRFMQETSAEIVAADELEIAELLIDSPGQSGVKKNRDHFVKRGRVSQLCPACAATALITLQLNSPEGGRGHLTGLRGGGPLTTLVIDRDGSLWSTLWLNVLERNAFALNPTAPNESPFPWADGNQGTLPPGSQITLSQADPRMCFWATPRRVTLDFSSAVNGNRCGLCGMQSSAAVRRYRSPPGGIKFPKEHWVHPFSPYRASDSHWHPLRAGAKDVAHRPWLAWILGNRAGTTRPAKVVAHLLESATRAGASGLRVWAFGYEMKKDNPMCWFESTIPLLGLVDCGAEAMKRVQAECDLLLESAELGGDYLRGAIRHAWFDREAKGDYSHVDAVYWSATEHPFYAHLRAVIEAARSGADRDPLPTREAWHRTLVATALRLFDEVFVGTGPIDRSNPRRVALAHKQLDQRLHGPKLRAALGLPVPEAADKPRRGKAAKPNANASKESA
jgi:CRISPR system Cascade subunit CasA